MLPKRLRKSRRPAAALPARRPRRPREDAGRISGSQDQDNGRRSVCEGKVDHSGRAGCEGPGHNIQALGHKDGPLALKIICFGSLYGYGPTTHFLAYFRLVLGATNTPPAPRFRPVLGRHGDARRAVFGSFGTFRDLGSPEPQKLPGQLLGFLADRVRGYEYYSAHSK